MQFLPPQLLPHPLSFSFDNTLSFLLLLLLESHHPLLMVCNVLRILSFVVSQLPGLVDFLPLKVYQPARRPCETREFWLSAFPFEALKLLLGIRGWQGVGGGGVREVWADIYGIRTYFVL